MRRRPPSTILMLQGPPCRFWRELGAGLRREGRRVLHVGFCLADAALWRIGGQRLYRGRLEDWPGWLSALVEREGVSDILYYADRLPYHAAAIAVARHAGARAWAIENGYLRPDWITMEPEAMGAFSRMSRDPALIAAAAEGLARPDMTPRYGHRFAREAASEVAYHLLQGLGRPAFRRYVSDKYYPPLLDYLSWLRKWAGGRRERREARNWEALCRAGRRFFLLPLQLQSDYQIRASSPYGCLSEMLEEVLASFAAHAPADAALLVKLHPMDNGWEAWPGRIRGAAARRGLAGRVAVIDGGSLELFLAAAEGVVTVNSTVGLLALRRGCPVIALGEAVYDIAGMTHGAGLARFWTAPAKPDAPLVDAFVAYLACQVQVRGSFYDPAGRRAAIAEICHRLSAPEHWWTASAPARLPNRADREPSMAAE